MSAELRELERITRVAPFGVQFRDPLSGALVRDGLQVSLHPEGKPQRRVTAHPNASGVYVMHEGPGLGRATRGRGDAAYWLSPPESRDYRCEVTDLWSRFQPLSFRVRLPFRGLFTPECASPPAQAQGVVLYCAPTRPVAGGYAVVRAELLDADTGEPAAWALVAAEYQGAELGRSLADRKGRLLLAFPYPEPERRPRRSPPESPPESEGGLMRWEVRLRARYDRALAAQGIPDYCALLAQPDARLLEEGSPLGPLGTTSVVLGREHAYARLFIAPA